MVQNVISSKLSVISLILNIVQQFYLQFIYLKIYLVVIIINEFVLVYTNIIILYKMMKENKFKLKNTVYINICNSHASLINWY